MEITITDQDDRVLGQTDLEGSRWEQEGNNFVNLSAVAISMVRNGNVKDFFIQSGNQRIYGDVAMPRRVGVGYTVTIHPRQLKVSFTEQRGPSVWNEHNTGDKIDFAVSTVGDMRQRAIELKSLIDTTGSPPLKATLDLIDTVFDVCATFKVIT